MTYRVDPSQLISQIKQGKNPQQLMLAIMEKEAATNPVMGNLLNLARQNRTADIEAFARNLAREQGIDFDQEFSRFKQQFNL